VTSSQGDREKRSQDPKPRLSEQLHLRELDGKVIRISWSGLKMSVKVLNPDTKEARLEDEEELENDVLLAPSGGGQAVAITGWYGRMGNNFMQMFSAILFAEIMGIQSLRFPEERHGKVRQQFPILLLPDSVNITPVDHPGTRCNSNYRNFWLACTVPAWQQQRVLHGVAKKYILPLVNQRTAEACQKENAHPFTGLTIHLRWGDKVKFSSAWGPWAPCSYFEEIIHRHGFQAVRIVTEPKSEHPCISKLQRMVSLEGKPLQVQMQNESVQADACAIIHARHFTFGEDSSFWWSLLTLNFDLESFFTFYVTNVKHPDWKPSCPAPNQSTSRLVHVYQLDGHYGQVKDIETAPARAVAFQRICDVERWPSKLTNRV